MPVSYKKALRKGNVVKTKFKRKRQMFMIIIRGLQMYSLDHNTHTLLAIPHISTSTHRHYITGSSFALTSFQTPKLNSVIIQNFNFDATFSGSVLSGCAVQLTAQVD